MIKKGTVNTKLITSITNRDALIQPKGMGNAVNFRGEFGRTPLFFAQTASEVERLYSLCAIATVVDQFDRTALFYAESREVIDALMAGLSNSDIVLGFSQVTDYCKRNPLHYASSAEVVEALVGHCIDVNHADCYGQTPLHTSENVAVTRALMNYGADVNAVDHQGNTPLKLAKSTEQLQVLEAVGVKK